MIKLSDLIKTQIQPSEKSRMKNFLYRGSRDQINLHPDFVKDRPGTIEGKGPLDTSDRPENKNTSQTYNNGYPWNVPEAGGIFENEQEKIFQNLIGREFQTSHLKLGLSLTSFLQRLSSRLLRLSLGLESLI